MSELLITGLAIQSALDGERQRVIDVLFPLAKRHGWCREVLVALEAVYPPPIVIESLRTSDGYDFDGYDRDGYARSGYNRAGVNRNGFTDPDWCCVACNASRGIA